MTTARALWTSFVVAFATLSYSLRFTEGKPPKDLLYKWSTLVGNLVQFAIIAAIVYGIAGLTADRRETLALRRPSSWATAAAIGAGVVVGMIILSSLLGPVLHPGREQGITPDTWQPSHLAAYIGNGIGIAVVAPIVEELTFRGSGIRSSPATGAGRRSSQPALRSGSPTVSSRRCRSSSPSGSGSLICAVESAACTRA